MLDRLWTKSISERMEARREFRWVRSPEGLLLGTLQVGIAVVVVVWMLAGSRYWKGDGVSVVAGVIWIAGIVEGAFWLR